MSAGQVVTLGCRLNIAESASIAAMLGARGDLVVVNTCAVTAEAVRHSRRAVRRAGRGGAQVIATGCAATIDPAGFGEIADAVVANERKLDPASWQAFLQTKPSSSPRRRGSSSDGSVQSHALEMGSRFRGNDEGMMRFGATHTRAFVPVQNGCDHACTFCVIPQGRGPSRSRPIAEVTAEIRALGDAGVAEVVLCGVDLTSYAPSLGALVEAILAACPALARLRLSSLDGIEIDARLFELLVGEPRVMPHVHLSLQSGDDLVLKRMRRRHSRSQAVELCAALHAARPEIAIGADLIAGFPTETAAMHGRGVALIRDCGIVHGHVFPYSPRPGTPAARMPQVEPRAVRERAAELRAVVADERRCWLESLIGTRHPVLAERDGTGHAPNFARFRLPPGTEPGRLVELTAASLEGGLLEGAR